jgi:hypothetical protein
VRVRFRPAYLLIPLLPISCALAYLVWVLASFSLCGVSGCTGGGFGAVRTPWVSVFDLLVSGAVAATPLWAVRWTGNRTVRLVIGSAFALAVAIAGFIVVTAANPGWAG